MSVLTMRQVAAELGVSYEHFRKDRRRLTAKLGFPPPFDGCRWDAEAVAAWRRRRSDPAAAAPEPSPAAKATHQARAASAWDQLDRMRGA